MKTIWQRSTTRSLSHYLNVKMADHLTRRSPELFRIRGNRQMAVFANDYIGILVNYFGFFEREDLDDLFSFLSPLRDVLSAGVALDIGANIGNHTMYFSERFARIHAFEPNPRTFELLRFNTAALANVSVHDIGLGDSRGQITLQQDPLNPGISSILPGSAGEGQPVGISVETLDDFQFEGRAELCFIKMDVEGFESNVLRGASATLATLQPVIVFEQHQKEFQGGASPSVSLLRELGYAFGWEQRRQPSRFWLGRRAAELSEILFGKTSRYVTAESVPPANYTMLVAVPPRFQSLLGI